MSTFYLVYDEDDNPTLHEDFAEAVFDFLRGVLNGDPVTLKYSP